MSVDPKTISKLYSDLVSPSAKEVGKIAARIPKAINAALSPLDIWILNAEYRISETKKILEEKLRNVDPEKIVSLEPYVAVPAIQAISYSMNSKELQNMFANLLAKSMHSDEKKSVHPSFVEIIKQLSPLDAQIFKKIFLSQSNPFINCYKLLAHSNVSTEKLLEENITALCAASREMESVSINNLSRNNLITASTDIYYTDESAYDPVFNSKNYKALKEKCIMCGYRTSIEKGVIDVTDFGKLFYWIYVNTLDKKS